MIIEYCATRLIPKIKIDFCPNKRRLILLSCPLQLISIDSRSPNGQRQAKRHRGLPDASFQFTQPKWAATRYSFIVASVASSFNSRSPSGLRLDEGKFIKFDQLFQFTQPKRAATVYASNTHQNPISFNSRSPSGLQSLLNFKMVIKMCFYSRSPSRLRHGHAKNLAEGIPVSIHAA